MSDAFDKLRVFGTEHTLDAPVALSAGPLSLELDAGKLRNIAWQGIELIRGIDCPIRDANWATIGVEMSDEAVSQDDAGWSYFRTMQSVDGALTGRFEAKGSADGAMSVEVSFTANVDYQTGRTGFTVLHPIAGLAGSPVQVTHGDGSKELSLFPELISPSQPVYDIAGLSYTIAGATAEISFEGEIFEMEDQRNWTDASYKTYCRPIGWERPFTIAAGETINQKILVTFSGEPQQSQSVDATGLKVSGVMSGSTTFPEVALAIEAAWLPEKDELELVREIGSSRVLARLSSPDALAEIATGIGSLQGACDLEFVLPNERADAEEAISSYAAGCEALNLSPDHVTGIPSEYMMSYQPEDVWPAGVTPQDTVSLLRKKFPVAQIGGGVLTNFTEFNRCRPESGACDFVTHSTNAIVHAADDRSVFQTLEALPMVYKSTEALAGAADYRLGLTTIAMSSNPYGAAPLENPSQIRLEMAQADPRQRGLFAAAWMVGAMAMTAGTSISRIPLAMPVGPLGVIYRKADWSQPLFDEDPSRKIYPAYHALKALCALSGHSRLAIDVPPGCVGLAAKLPHKKMAIVANTSAENGSMFLAHDCDVQLLDSGSFDDATRDPGWLGKSKKPCKGNLSLGPYAVAFIEL